MDVGGRDEDVEVRSLGDADRLDRLLRVAVAAAREGGNRDAPDLLRDPVDCLPVAGRGGGEARLDDVDVEAHELARDLELLGGGEAGAGRLLAVAQGGVEDPDRAGRHERAGGYRDGHQWDSRAAPVAAAWAWPAETVTGSRNGMAARRRAPTCSIW